MCLIAYLILIIQTFLENENTIKRWYKKYYKINNCILAPNIENNELF